MAFPIETIMLNILYAGEYKAMMPKLKSKNFKNMELIRPLYYIKEEDIWNCLVELHWKKDKGLLLSDVVDDILNTENSVIDNYVKNEMKKMKREANYDVEII